MSDPLSTPAAAAAPAGADAPAVPAGGARASALAALAEPAEAAAGDATSDDRRLPHVVAWNLTRRCNLACAHCYIAAGSWHAAEGELDTAECHRILDELLEVNPAPLLILSGGEPLLRDDLEEIARHAADGGATVVVGTNGTRLTSERIESLKAAGVTGVAISVDSLDPAYHDRFRHGTGALEDTMAAVDRLREQELDFIVQTTLTRGNRREVPALIAWAASHGAVSFNLYFLVATGRGEGMRGLSPDENDEVLRDLVRLERDYRGRMMIRSKCQPQIMRHVAEADTESPLLNYATRCPCGVHYCRITPEGKVTPCPYMPVVAGDLGSQSFEEIWFGSPVFRDLRAAASGGASDDDGGGAPARAPAGDAADAVDASGPRLGGKCGRCEYRLMCGGCRARAFADGGDYLGADESCAYEPDGSRPLVRPSGVTYGEEADPELPWTDAARRRIRRVPSFVRGVVTRRVENFARDRGYEAVTPDVLDEVRRSLPVDFSKRKPFFLRSDDEE